MNPDSAIRPWLLAVGAQFGIREAHNYIWADASTRPQEPYFTYRITKGRPTQKSINRDDEADGYTAKHRAWKNHETTVRIKIYREVNGIDILEKCAIAAQMDDRIKTHFKKSGCAFREVSEDIEDESPDSDQLTNSDYRDQIRQKMDVVFFDTILVEMSEENGIVETLVINTGI